MNPLLGVFFHWLGGLAAGSFYAPYKQVRRWSWETYWLAGGLFSWILAPWLFSLLMVPGTAGILREATWGDLTWPYLFGVMWGVGGLTFGLSMRYLGISLGMAVALGLCAVFGTVIPPIFKGTFLTDVVGTESGRMVLFGLTVCVLGISLAGMAGISKEREMPAVEGQGAVKEFNLRKGLLVATVAGVMSACFAFGLSAGDAIQKIAKSAGTNPLWCGLPVLIVILAGGFTTNCFWCLLLNRKNRSGGEYFGRMADGDASAPVMRNWIFCALAGTIWYFQFFFYSMGESQMGKYGFSSWTMHMASIIIFSTLWGIALKEWNGTSRRTKALLAGGLALLVISTMIVGYGNSLAATPAGH
jgi:L-rhamnose-H+ transport protein